MSGNKACNSILFIDTVTETVTEVSKPSENLFATDTVNNPKPKLGKQIGTIGNFEGETVIVNGKDDTISKQAQMGSALIVDANGEYIYLQSTFPMQTTVKCKVTSGKRSLIKKGMKVYLKP